MNNQNLLKFTNILENKQIAPNAFVLSFPRLIDFQAGQVISLDIEANGTPRIYSIASGETDAQIKILFDEKPNGKLSPKLTQLKKGDRIYYSQAFGHYKGNSKVAWWIASGTGIAPFISMFHSGLGANKTLIHGGRFLSSFYFSEKLEPALKDNYIRCCSQETSKDVYSGRLTSYLRGLNHLPKDIQYYLCGSPEMVVDVREILIDKGIAYENIIAETYF